MKRLLVLSGGATLLLFCVLGAYLLGFRHGWHYMGLSEAVPKGTLALTKIVGLRAGKTDAVLFQLESEVDSGLLMAAEVEAGLGFERLDALTGRDLSSQMSEYLRRLATYRRATPSQLDYIRSGDAIAARGEQRLGAEIRDADAVLNGMVERHAR